MGEWLSGQLDVHHPAGSDGSPVVAAAREAYAQADPESLTDALETVLAAARVGPLLVDLTLSGQDEPWAITAVHQQGAEWVPVFSTVSELARWRQACGRGDESVHYAAVPGMQLPELLPADGAEPVGIVLDPGSEAPLALPAHQLTGEGETR